MANQGATGEGQGKSQKEPRTQRIVHADGTVEYISLCDDEVDRTSEASFPASDPPAFTGVTRAGNPRKPVNEQ